MVLELLEDVVVLVAESVMSTWEGGEGSAAGEGIRT
jgi:hypothetical protein